VIKVALFDQNGTHFASLDMLELPHKDDTVEIGFPNEQVVKSFTIWRVIHKMIQLPTYETKYVEGVAVQCRNNPPWRWEFHLHGYLYDPKSEVPEVSKCICFNTPNEVKCPKHGHQSAGRGVCPECRNCYLGYCAQGEYCTDDRCKYVA
jgi:hypothetical protein